MEDAIRPWRVRGSSGGHRECMRVKGGAGVP